MKIAAGLHGVDEARWGLQTPGPYRLLLRQAVEAVVQLDGVEYAGIVLKPTRPGNGVGIELPFPVLVFPA